MMGKGSKAPKMDPVRVRFAPSPTGSLHVGGARTALFNWLLARKTKGKFIVRVEDTDEARSSRESEQSILDDLKWMNMDWDEGPDGDGFVGPHGPYRQSERKSIYKQYADKLMEDGFAYKCFSTEEELAAKKEAAEAAGDAEGASKYDGTWRDADPAEVQKKLDEGTPYVVRFAVPKGKIVSIDDAVRGTVSWDAEATLGDFIMLRSNGMPVYNFCVAVDDATMQITHVIRAEEHLTNTLRQMLLLESMGYKAPIYAHCSLILGQDRSKLSKRHGATSVQQFSEQGFVPDAMMNYLANLGWNDGTNKEIYKPEELVKAFSLDRVVKSSAVFDMDKLRWVNQQHLKTIPKDEMIALTSNVLKNGENGGISMIKSDADEEKIESFVAQAVKIALKDMQLVTDARPLVGKCLEYDINSSFANDPEIVEVLDNDFEKMVNTLVADYEAGKLPSGIEDDFGALWKAYVNGVGEAMGLKGKALFHPIRLALTGRMSGPDVGEQILLWKHAKDVANGCVPLEARIATLKSLDITEVKAKVDAQTPKVSV